VATREARLLAGVALLALVIQTWSARRQWTDSGVLGWANALTWARILATASLLLVAMPREGQAALAFAIFALDGVDGAIARARGTSSEFGAQLDKECDAFFVVTLSVLLWLQGVAGPWVLIAGLWRYAYGLLVALGPELRPAPRSNWGRYSYSTACVSLVLALVPLGAVSSTLGAVSTPLAALATVAISLSFLRSIYFSFARN
jgi:phosphatidylglycerophosphate synthase